jgi:MFS family permease
MAVVGDLVAPHDRGRYQGLFGGVFGVSVVAGPLLGGFFVDNLSWRWIFYVNLPVGVVALAVIATSLRSREVTTRHRIDWLGTVVLAAGLSSVILYTSLGGTSYAWDAPGMLAAISAGVALLALFPLIEAHAEEPILLPVLFRNMTFRTTSAQNAVDYRLLGVATSGATLFRQLGGSISVSVFGAIFTNELGRQLVRRLPAGVHAPAHASPAAIQHLPPAIHAVYVTAVAVALHPVFSTAAAAMVVAFGLSWLLGDVPLRETARSDALRGGSRDAGRGSGVAGAPATLRR